MCTYFPQRGIELYLLRLKLRKIVALCVREISRRRGDNLCVSSVSIIALKIEISIAVIFIILCTIRRFYTYFVNFL